MFKKGQKAQMPMASQEAGSGFMPMTEGPNPMASMPPNRKRQMNKNKGMKNKKSAKGQKSMPMAPGSGYSGRTGPGMM